MKTDLESNDKINRIQITKTDLPFDYNPTILPVIVLSHLLKGKRFGTWTHHCLFAAHRKTKYTPLP